MIPDDFLLHLWTVALCSRHQGSCLPLAADGSGAETQSQTICTQKESKLELSTKSFPSEFVETHGRGKGESLRVRREGEHGPLNELIKAHKSAPRLKLEARGQRRSALVFSAYMLWLLVWRFCRTPKIQSGSHSFAPLSPAST